MIIEIIKIPDIPAFDKISEKLQGLIGIKLQASSPNWSSSISSTSRNAMNQTEGLIEHYYVSTNNLLDAVLENNPELHKVLLEQIKSKHLEDVFLVLDKIEVKKIF